MRKNKIKIIKQKFPTKDKRDSLSGHLVPLERLDDDDDDDVY